MYVCGSSCQCKKLLSREVESSAASLELCPELNCEFSSMFSSMLSRMFSSMFRSMLSSVFSIMFSSMLSNMFSSEFSSEQAETPRVLYIDKIYYKQALETTSSKALLSFIYKIKKRSCKSTSKKRRGLSSTLPSFSPASKTYKSSK